MMTVEPRRGVTVFEPRTGAPVFLSDMIMELGLAEKERVEAAVDTARSSGETVGRILIREGHLTEDQLARALAARYGLNHIDLAEFDVDAAAANLLPPAAAQRYRAVPVAFEGHNGLLVAMADPSDSLALNDISFMTKLEVYAAVAAENLIAELVGRLPLPATERRETPSYPPPAPTPPPAAPVSDPLPSAFEPPPSAAAPAPAAVDDSELKALRAELESTNAALDDERSKHAASVAELRQQLKQARSETATETVVDTEELDQARAELERVREKLEKKKQDLDAARAELAEKTEALEEAQNNDTAERAQKDLERASHELEVVRGDLDQARGDLDHARSELGQKSSELDSARSELSQKSGELDHARSELGHKSGDLERARTDLAQKGGELDQVRTELDEHRADLERTRGELEGAKAEADTSRGEVAQVRAELDQTRAELEAANGEVARAAEALEKLDQLDEAEARVHEAHGTLEKMRNDFELEREQFAVTERDLRARLASEEEQHEAAREAQVAMQKRVEALRAQNAALLDAYATAKRWSAEFARGAKELANTLEQPVLDDAVRAQQPSEGDDARREGGPSRFAREDEEGNGNGETPPDWLK
jgi:chromosome segregation ATPase